MKSANDPKDREKQMLDDREQLVLHTIINEYIQKSEPIGSRNVSKVGPLKMSPATIRNIMGDLEEKGYLVQPHTSAGRIPTDLGYRYYIDHFVALERELDRIIKSELDEAFHFPVPNIPVMMREFSKRLGLLTSSVGFVVASRTDSTALKQIEFTRLNRNSVLAILISKAGIVQNILLSVEATVTDNDLLHFSNYLNEELRAHGLAEVAESLSKELSEHKGEIYDIFSRIEELREDSLGFFVEGAANILNFPEFQDTARLKNLLRTLDEKQLLCDILDKCLDTEGVQIFVGSEIGIGDADELGIVTRSYSKGGRVVGMLGVIGPKRMQYSKMISVVDYSADIITGMLNQLYGGYE